MSMKITLRLAVHFVTMVTLNSTEVNQQSFKLDF